MPCVADELTKTIAASWRSGLEGVPSGNEDSGRVHWQTKTNYYRATAELLQEPDTKLTWQNIVRSVRPEGNRGTFYRVIGSNAAHPLLGAYRSAKRGYAADITELYDRIPAVQQLVDETKVWTYWGYREGWVTQLELTADVTRRAAAESLVRVVMDWAMRYPQIASALDCSPPMSAAEDMVVIWDGNDAAIDAHGLLVDVIRSGLGPLGTTANGVLKSITEQLDRKLPPRGKPAMDPVTRLAGVAFDTIRWLGTLSGESQRESVRSAVTVVEDALANLKRYE